MEIIVQGSYKFNYEKVSFNFDSKVKVNTGKFNSFSDLVILKDIEKEVSEFLGIYPGGWRSRISPGMSKTSVYNLEDDEFQRIKTIVRRDNIIENILKND